MSRTSWRNGAVGLGGHPIGAAERVEVVDVGRAEIDLQRLEHAGRPGRPASPPSRGRCRHRSWACAVLNSENTPARPGVWLAAPTMLLAAASSACGPRPRRSWTIILKPPALPMPRTGGGGMTMMKASWIAPSRLRRLGQDVLGGRAPLPRARRTASSGDEDRAGIGRVGEGGAVEAGERHGVGHARRLEDDLGRLRAPPHRCAPARSRAAAG